jgi:Protein of unknown function (DUF1344)
MSSARDQLSTRAWLALATLVLSVGLATLSRPAFAQPAQQGERQIESKIINVNGELIQLDDGTVVQVPHALALQKDLREGRKVKVSYEIKDGKPVAKSIQFLDEPSPGVTK